MTTPIADLDPVELSQFARLTQQDFDAQSQSLARFFPYNPLADIRYSYSKGATALLDEATFRAFDAESPTGRRPGSARVTGELLPISRKIPLAEYAQLRLRNAGNDEVVAAVFNDAARLARGIAARFERARGQLLVTGKVTLSENGVVSEYDAGRHASLTVTPLAGNHRWNVDHADSTPIADVLAWKTLVQTANGELEPNRLLVSTTVLAALQSNDEVRGFNQALANAPSMVTREAVAAAFLGLAGVTLEVYETPVGMSTAPIAANQVVLLRDNVPLGSTAYGIPLEAQEPEYAGLAPQPGVVAGGWKTTDPINVWTHAVAIGLPLLGAPDLTLSCQVID